jgi:hypothetical protein
MRRSAREKDWTRPRRWSSRPGREDIDGAHPHDIPGSQIYWSREKEIYTGVFSDSKEPISDSKGLYSDNPFVSSKNKTKS